MRERLKGSPTLFQNRIAAFHCGAGCAIGDVIAESIVPALGPIFAGDFGSNIILDFIFAYVLGIAFQYSVNGRQYIIGTGNNAMYAFALPN